MCELKPINAGICSVPQLLLPPTNFHRLLLLSPAPAAGPLLLPFGSSSPQVLATSRSRGAAVFVSHSRHVGSSPVRPKAEQKHKAKSILSNFVDERMSVAAECDLEEDKARRTYLEYCRNMSQRKRQVWRQRTKIFFAWRSLSLSYPLNSCRCESVRLFGPVHRHQIAIVTLSLGIISPSTVHH